MTGTGTDLVHLALVGLLDDVGERVVDLVVRPHAEGALSLLLRVVRRQRISVLRAVEPATLRIRQIACGSGQRTHVARCN